MNSCELVTLVSTLACAIVNNFRPEDAAVLASVLVQLGDSIATVLAANALKDSCLK